MNKEWKPVITGGPPYVGVSLSIIMRMGRVVDAAREWLRNDNEAFFYGDYPQALADALAALDQESQDA